MPKFVQNPELYRKLSEPFENLMAANAALNGLMDDMRILREKHHIPDLYWVARITAKSEDGGETGAYSNGGMGNVLEWEAMLAYALGVEQTDRQQRIGQLLAEAGAVTRKRNQ
jgi:hypothetical protein